MRVSELIEKLKEFPEDAFVILSTESGASELEDSEVEYERMNYVEYPRTWNHLPLTYGWEYPSVYKRKIISSADVVVIG